MDQKQLFDLELIRRYDKAGPRYTSYPTAVQFTSDFGPDDYKAWAEKSNQRAGNKPLSLYFHIPFCDTLCFYCGCNKVVTKRREKAEPYLQRLYKEMEMQSAMFDSDRMVDQLHWGGGTPTFISHDQMRELMAQTRKHFKLHDDDTGEYSIEIDPREVTEETFDVLRSIGFNRISLGVQDLNPVVQKAVNRIQPEEVTQRAMENVRKFGFKSLSVDLIYGLPFQTIDSFEKTLARMIELSPDRMSIFNYAHLPEMFMPQRRIREEDLPVAADKLQILHNTIDQLTDAGYVYIGMDHFAKPDDELAIAQRDETLYRNFQGYSTHSDCDLIGMGITSIGMVGNSYSQNVKTLEEYYEIIDAGQLPVFRGLELNEDDILRREVITRLICHFHLDKSKIENEFGIEFDKYFVSSLQQLETMEKDGLVELGDKDIKVLTPGRLLIRNICMAFDFYAQQTKGQRFSKVI